MPTVKREEKATAPISSRVNRRGFTLVELSVVIVLIALFAATILPKLVVVRDSQRAAAFRTEITRFFREARENAVTRRAVIEVRYDGDSWEMVQLPSETEDAEEEQLSQLGMLVGTSATAFRMNDADVAADEFLVRCYPDGTVTDAVLEWGGEGETYVLNLDGPSGRVTMRRGTIENQAEEDWPAGEIEKRAG